VTTTSPPTPSPPATGPGPDDRSRRRRLGVAMAPRAIAPYASRIAGGLLALSGLYLLYCWLPPLLGAARPSDGGVSTLSAQVSTWLSTHQPAGILVAGLLVAGTAAATLLASRTRTPGTPRPRTMSESKRPR